MESVPIKVFLVAVIFLNAVCIGVMADYGDEKDVFWVMVEMIFLIVFTVELILNLLAFGWIFFEDYWHWLDTFVVLISLIDFAVTQASASSSTGLSVVRLVRVVRVLRVVSIFDRMIYLVTAFARGMQNVAWVIMLLGLMLYMAAVLGNAFFGEKDSSLHRDLALQGMH